MDMTPKALLVAKIDKYAQLLAQSEYDRATYDQTGDSDIRENAKKTYERALTLRKEITVEIEAIGL